MSDVAVIEEETTDDWPGTRVPTGTLVPLSSTTTFVTTVPPVLVTR
jgi:hypothetical protein